jgi:prepilin-type N-terminal cleavage/methylation domain-containing protein
MSCLDVRCVAGPPLAGAPLRCVHREEARRRAPAPQGGNPGRVERAFTLVELIVVMVLLLIVASLVATQMSSFFRGRALSSEARRMLSLINHGQTRAVAQGVPVLLWIDPTTSSYGLELQGSHAHDDRPITYTADPSLTLETPAVADQPVSEDGDETLGLGENLSSIRFNPDGFFDEASVTKIIIRQGTEGALEISPAANRLGYEIRPAILSN